MSTLLHSGTWPLAADTPTIPFGYYVYLLFRGDVVVYVGRSTDPRARFRRHGKSGKQFDSWSARAVLSGEQMRLEQYLIDLLSPEYNRETAVTYR